MTLYNLLRLLERMIVMRLAMDSVLTGKGAMTMDSVLIGEGTVTTAFHRTYITHGGLKT
jgi:hypothetical protein